MKISLLPSLLRCCGVALISSLLLAGCAHHAVVPREGAVNSQKSERNADPLERLNRIMWHVNHDFLDPLLLRPFAVVWRDYLPRPARQAIRNVLSNLDEPSTAVNYALQAKFALALRHLGRFLFNTIGGLGGIVDIATLSGLPRGLPCQFGNVLGHFHIGQGPYMMLPVYGPTTPRQLLGRIPDQCYFPLAYLNPWGMAGKWLLESIEKRAGFLSKEPMLRLSQDEYLTFREAYLQWMDFIASEEKGTSQSGPDHWDDHDGLDSLD